MALSREQPAIGVHTRQGGPGPHNLKICSMNIPLTVANFFSEVFCCIKTGEVEVNCY